MFPEMRAKPGAAGGPDAVDAVDGGGAAPDVGVVMEDPAAGVVEIVRGAAAADGQVLHHVEQRAGAFTEVGRPRGPVIHLDIDVGGVFAFPGGIEEFIPDALQVGRLMCPGRLLEISMYLPNWKKRAARAGSLCRPVEGRTSGAGASLDLLPVLADATMRRRRSSVGRFWESVWPRSSVTRPNNDS